MILGEIAKSPTEVLRFSTESYKGRDYVDIRIYFTTDEGAEWKPTKKGVTIAPDKLEEAINFLTSAKQSLEKK